MTLSEIVGGNPFKNIQRLDISQEEYFAIDAYSSTDLRTLYADRGQPYGMAQKKAGDYVETDAMLLGSAVDCMITEPKEFDNRFVEAPRSAVTPNTALQQKVCDEILRGTDPAEAHAMHYKNSGEKAVAQLMESFENYIALNKLVNLGEGTPRRILSVDLAERAREPRAEAQFHAAPLPESGLHLSLLKDLPSRQILLEHEVLHVLDPRHGHVANTRRRRHRAAHTDAHAA